MFLWIFTPKPWGNDPIWRSHIFQGVCWNHQLVLVTLFFPENLSTLKLAPFKRGVWTTTPLTRNIFFVKTSFQKHLNPSSKTAGTFRKSMWNQHILANPWGSFFRKNMGSRSIPSSQNQLQESLNFGRRPRPSTASTTSIHSRAQVTPWKKGPGVEIRVSGGILLPSCIGIIMKHYKDSYETTSIMERKRLFSWLRQIRRIPRIRDRRSQLT